MKYPFWLNQNLNGPLYILKEKNGPFMSKLHNKGSKLESQHHLFIVYWKHLPRSISLPSLILNLKYKKSDY